MFGQQIVYTPLNQLPYCCVPACLSIILDRRGIVHGSQEEIGYALGLTVPEEAVALFNNVRTGEKPISGYGTQVQKEAYSINKFFQEESIPLKEKYFFLDDIDDISLFLEKYLKVGDDVIVCFNHEALYGTGDWGHVSLVIGVKENTVFLLDPEDVEPKVRAVDLDDLVEAIRVHGRTCRGGFWVISEK